MAVERLNARRILDRDNQADLIVGLREARFVACGMPAVDAGSAAFVAAPTNALPFTP
jgi:hypothetical protein